MVLRCDSQSGEWEPRLSRNGWLPLTLTTRTKCLGANMLASPVPIYLGCAGLIVGSLGLGAQHMLGGNSVSATNAESEQPLFARSVEEASLPAPHWSSQHSNVAYYDPMVKLLTTPSRSVPPAPATPQASPQQANTPPASQPAQPQAIEGAQQEPRAAAPREIVRDIPQQTSPSKRNRSARTRDDATTPAEQVDPRDAYAKADRDSRSQERQRNARQLHTRQVDNERRDGSRRSERRYGNRDDSEPVDTRSRSDRRRVEVDEPRQREGERRVIVREESEPHIVRGPEPREGGFSPFGLFGIFGR